MRARGTHDNIGHRFEPIRIEATDDNHWHQDPEPDRIATEARELRAREIISTNDSPDVPFRQSINPYQGCEHGCIYCFARPSHAWQELSPGLDFETRITVKTNAAERLRATLDRPGYRVEPIALGVNTDAYQPLEKRYRITREILQVLLEYRHPVFIITKSALILRDLDLLSELARRRLCSVRVSLTSLDTRLKGQLEPRASGPAARLKIIRELAAAGVPVGTIIAPVIPFINDHELEDMLCAAAAHGARQASWILLRLPYEVAPLFRDWLERYYPDRADHVMNRVRDLRGGKANDSRWGKRMTGEGPLADLYRQRFRRQCRALGLNSEDTESLDSGQFRRPGGEQMGLF